MYTVTVFRSDTNESVDERDFPLGPDAWEKIGFWINWHVFDSARYYVKIRFVEC